MRLSLAAFASLVVLFAAAPAQAGGRALPTMNGTSLNGGLPGMNGTSLNGGLPGMNGTSLNGGLPTMNGSKLNAESAPVTATGVTTPDVVAVHGRLILR